jgi:hypothetical protein
MGKAMRNSFDENPTVHNWHYEVAVTIDRPAARVWKQYLDIGSWIHSHNFETVSGKPYEVGSITRFAIKGAKEMGMPPAHHHYCKIIKLIPEHQYLIKAYTEKGGSYGWQFITFDDTRFIERDGKTKVTFNFYAEHKAQEAPKDWIALREGLEASREGMSRNFDTLKRIVESP